MKYKLLLLFILFCKLDYAQITGNTKWNWLSGDSITNVAGVYGTQGATASGNKPGARSGSTSWTDLSGDLWLFSGTNGSGNFNDLWRYNIGLGQWTWVKGSSVTGAPPIYGTQGSGSSSTTPGARSGSAGIADRSGNLWMFGGFGTAVSGTGFFNDLWKYSVNTGQWVWQSGSSVINAGGNYGTQGVPSVSNSPSSRQHAVMWCDKSGILWLFGGDGVGGLNYSDLWRYNPISGEWTWMKGASTANQKAVYGQIAVEGINNKPGARTSSVSWRDSIGNLWVFGGYGYASDVYDGILNDLWRYNVNSNQWAFFKGDTVTGGYAVYGVKDVATSSSKPGARQGAVSFVDSSGRLLLFGGYGTSTADQSYGKLNDLWKYNIDDNSWTWVKGDTLIDATGVYGSKGVATPANKPGSRENATGWTDRSGNLWLFAGNGFAADVNGTDDNLNDLWKLSNIYIFTGDGQWNIPGNWNNNTVAPTNVPAGTEVIINPSGQCIQNGNLTTQNGGKITVNPAKTLQVQGDLNNAGTISGAGILNLNSGSSQLTSSGILSTTMVLASKKMVLSSDLAAGAILLTNKSSIQLGNFNLRMDTFALSGNDSNFIITNGNGNVLRKVGASPQLFPIGTDSASYTPVTITGSVTSPTANIKVRVVGGVSNTSIRTTAAVTSGNVNKTWIITDSATRSSTMKFEWNVADEQPSFNRANAYVAQSHACQPPPNCTDIYYDVQARTAAAGTGPFSLTRANVTSPTTFIIKSSPDTSTFTGNGSWDDPNNWTVGIVPPKVINVGREIIINHPAGGECLVTGDITVKPGARLNVLPGKKLRVTGKIIVE